MYCFDSTRFVVLEGLINLIFLDELDFDYSSYFLLILFFYV